MNVIKAYREKHKLSQKELADKLGVTQDFISKVELGQRSFSFRRAIQIEEKLKGAITRGHLRPDIWDIP